MRPLLNEKHPPIPPVPPTPPEKAGGRVKVGHHPKVEWRKLPWTPVFLMVLRETGNVRAAAEAAGVGKARAYILRDNDSDFREQWEIALDDAVDLLERAAWERATKGVSRLKFDRDGVPLIDPRTGTYYEEFQHSDHLTKFLLEGFRPERYRQKQQVAINFVIQTLEQDAERLGIPHNKVIDMVSAVLAGEPLELPEKTATESAPGDGTG